MTIDVLLYWMTAPSQRWLLVVLGLVSGAISYLFSEATILDRLRELATKQSTLLGQLLRCGICLSHWFSAVIWLALDDGRMPVYVVAINWLATAWIGAISWAIVTSLAQLRAYLDYELELKMLKHMFERIEANNRRPLSDD